MSELIRSDAVASIPAGSDAFTMALDEHRRKLPQPKARSRNLDFQAWSTTAEADRSLTDPSSWKLAPADKRIMYKIRQASENGTLTLYQNFVFYRRHALETFRCSSLFMVPVAFDAPSGTASPTAGPEVNRPLIDLLHGMGIEVDLTTDPPTLTQVIPSPAEVEHRGRDRIGPNMTTPTDPATYLDAHRHRALRDNTLLRFFVEGSASERVGEAIASEKN